MRISSVTTSVYMFLNVYYSIQLTVMLGLFSELTCAPGSAQAACIATVCSELCEADPDAQCLVNYCEKPLFNGEPVPFPICSEVYVKGGKLVDECNPQGTL